jgi:hypothetical protein
MLSCIVGRKEFVTHFFSAYGPAYIFDVQVSEEFFGFKFVLEWILNTIFCPAPIRMKLIHMLALARIMFLQRNNSSWLVLPGAENPASAEQSAGARPPAAAGRGGARRLRPNTGQSRQAGQSSVR